MASCSSGTDVLFEKVLRLKEILTYLNTDGYLHEHLALKGGTAINMTIFNLPRLSVDLDLDFTPNLPLEDMEKAREKDCNGYF